MKKTIIFFCALLCSVQSQLARSLTIKNNDSQTVTVKQIMRGNTTKDIFGKNKPFSSESKRSFDVLKVNGNKENTITITDDGYELEFSYANGPTLSFPRVDGGKNDKCISVNKQGTKDCTNANNLRFTTMTAPVKSKTIKKVSAL